MHIHCIQDTLSSRERLAECAREQRYLAYKYIPGLASCSYLELKSNYGNLKLLLRASQRNLQVNTLRSNQIYHSIWLVFEVLSRITAHLSSFTTRTSGLHTNLYCQRNNDNLNTTYLHNLLSDANRFILSSDDPIFPTVPDMLVSGPEETTDNNIVLSTIVLYSRRRRGQQCTYILQQLPARSQQLYCFTSINLFNCVNPNTKFILSLKAVWEIYF